MKRRMLAEAAFQLALFLAIVTISWGVAELLAAAGVTGARFIGSVIATGLIFYGFSNWGKIFDRLWPRAKG